MHDSGRFLRCILPSLIIIAGVGACANETQPWYHQETLDLTATVTDIDAEDRLVSLRGSSGYMTTVYAGSQIRNFDQIKVGDQVAVTYRAAIAAAVNTSDRTTAPVQGAVAVHRAEPGGKPHGVIEASVTTRVQIDAVDTSFDTITFRRDDGLVRTVAVEDPDVRKFIRGLKPGDFVDVTYTEAVAVTVQAIR